MNNPIFMNYVLPAILVIGFAIYMFRPKKSKIERNMGEVTYHYLAPKDAESKLNEPDIILIDVRNEEYYAKSHLKDSINFPYVDIHHAVCPIKKRKSSFTITITAIFPKPLVWNSIP